MGQISYKLAEQIKYHQYDGTYASFLALNSYFGLDPMNSTWVDTTSQLHITSGSADAYVNIDGFLVLLPDRTYVGVDWDSHFRDGYTTDIALLDPQWALDKSSYSTKTVADTLYKPYSYVPSWSSITSKPTFSTVATSGDYNDLSNKPTIPSLTNYVQATLGTSTFSGITLTTQYTITHGLGFTPSSVFMQPKSANASALSYVDNITSTTFRITFLAIPILGTNNISFSWIAYR